MFHLISNLISSKKNIAIMALILFIVAGGLFYWWRMETSQRAYESHASKAAKLEKMGNEKAALREYEKALKYLPLNEEESLKKTKKTIARLKRKIEEESKKTAEVNDSTSTAGTDSPGVAGADGGDSGGDSGGGAEVVIPGANVDVSKVVLAELLPNKFENLHSEPMSGKEVASVRFDDASSESVIIIYVYRLSTAKEAFERAKASIEELYVNDASKVNLRGYYSGQQGYCGVSAQGDVMLSFSYSSLVFECLARSKTLDKAEIKEKLAALQGDIKKP